MSLNFKHLRYFWAVAHSGNLTRAAEQLHVSQSALSVQIRQLEEWLGQDLFERQGRSLVLTEAGRIALEYADTLFSVSDEFVNVLKGRDSHSRQVIRIGAVTTLSRNFQITFLEPLLVLDDVVAVLRSDSQEQLLTKLESQDLDVVLTSQLPPRDQGRQWLVHTIDKQPVSLVGHPTRGGYDRSLLDMLREHPVIVPTVENAVRIGFDAWCERNSLSPIISAEVDDMALMRLMVREDFGLAVVPPIVVRDELNSGTLRDFGEIPALAETFHAVTLKRKFPNPLLPKLLRRIDDGLVQKPASR
ncbi:MAG: LysR family transcriptional regulator [Pseudomonadota bacterium]